jgi:uncharacterized protein YjbI with pentapeptide repeats
MTDDGGASEAEKDKVAAPAATPPAEDPGQAALDALAKLTEQVRASAKWLIGSFAAVGALLVPGLQLADLGSLHGMRLFWAILAAGVAAAAVIYAAVTVARVLGISRPTLAQLAAREEKADPDDALMRLVKANRTLLEREANDLRDLQARYRRARARAADTTASPVGVEVAQGRAAAYAHVLDSVGSVADFQDVRAEFVRRRGRVAVATAVVALAMAGFALAIHKQGHATSDFSKASLGPVDLSGTNLDEADFHDSKLDHVDLHETSLHEADLSGADLEGVDLTGADTRDVNTEGTTVDASTCVDGLPSAGRVVSACFVPKRLPPPSAARGRPDGTG